jgi:hypothetical protein
MAYPQTPAAVPAILAVEPAHCRLMGKNNKQRRAASKRKRRRGGAARARGHPHGRHDGAARTRRDHRPGGGAGGRAFEPPPGAEDLLRAAVYAWRADPRHWQAALDALAGQPDAALSALETLLAQALDRSWQRGWSPSDVARASTRLLSADHGSVAAAVLVAERGKLFRPQNPPT